MKVQDLKPAGYNPRKITDKKLSALKKSLEEFGDLSGIVFNIQTQTLIGGHQRTKNFDPAWEIIKEPHTDAVGTVALGWIETPAGRMNYREVDWPEKKEKMANIAANKQGGEFDNNELQKIIDEIEIADIDLDLIGFDETEISEIITQEKEVDDADESIVPDRDPNILIRISLHPGIWLGKREEINTILEKLKKTYNCEVKVEE